MIDVKELRVGNYLFPSEKEYGKRPFKIGAGDILEIQKGMPTYKYEPIPLTPDILKKCGCKQGNDKEMWRHSSGVWLTKVYNKNKFFIHGFRAGHTIAFLHQYQNAVFVLTGEEMIIEIQDS